MVEAASVRGTRLIDIDDFFLGVKRNALAPDELIRAVRMPVAAGPQQFAKVGTRNAMVIAVCTVAVALDPAARTVGTGIGSAAPTPRRAPRPRRSPAELPWDGGALDPRARPRVRRAGRRRRGADRRRAGHGGLPRGTRWPCWPGARCSWAWTEH